MSRASTAFATDWPSAGRRCWPTICGGDENAGVSAVVVTTTKFDPVATTLSANFGLADTRRLVLPHPLGGTDEATLYEWADAATDQLIALLTSTDV